MSNHRPVTVGEALQYNHAALKIAIDKAKSNVTLLKKTIENEKETISRYKEMIEILKVHKK